MYITGFRGAHAHPLVVDDDLRGCYGWRAEYRTIQSAIGGRHHGEVGIHLGPDSDDALVTGNTALGNGGEDGNFDCQDESRARIRPTGTAGTENT